MTFIRLARLSDLTVSPLRLRASGRIPGLNNLVLLSIISAAVWCVACSNGVGVSDSIEDTIDDVTPDTVSDIAGDAAADVSPDISADVVETCRMKIGVAMRDITPVVEPFDDLNGNNWRDDDEDYTDTNDNGSYDPTYIAGFGARQAQGVHDSVWSRCMAIESGGLIHLFCATDSIGMGLSHYDVILSRIRELCPECDVSDSRFTWATTHTHQGPDTQGVWDLMPLEYLEQIDELTAQAAIEAIDNMVPGRIRVAVAQQPDSLVRDIDPPELIDREIPIIQAVDELGGVIGTMISVANHPESAGPDNLEVSSDFPHYLRERVEAVQGGVAIYFSGALGLMATPVMDWDDTGMHITESTGNAYGDIINEALDQAGEPSCQYLVSAEARPAMKLENFDFWAGIKAGLINGFEDYLYGESGEETSPCGFMGCVDVPVSVIRFGDLLTWINVPGEIVPELVFGIYPDPEPVPGEYADAEREPHLTGFVTTPYRFIAGLADTEIGYIYPRYQEDRANHEHQRNSPSPNVAATLMDAYSDLFDQIREPDSLNGR